MNWLKNSSLLYGVQVIYYVTVDELLHLPFLFCLLKFSCKFSHTSPNLFLIITSNLHCYRINQYNVFKDMCTRSVVNVLITFMQSYADSSAAGGCLYCDGICLSWAFASFLFLIKIDQVRINFFFFLKLFFQFLCLYHGCNSLFCVDSGIVLVVVIGN